MMDVLSSIFLTKAGLWLIAAFVVQRQRKAPALAGVTFLVAVLHALASIEGARFEALALLVAAGAHFLVALPDGKLGRANLRVLVAALWAASGVAAWLMSADKVSPTVALPSLAAIGALAILGPSVARYHKAKGAVRQGMQWIGWAVTAAAGVMVVAAALQLLVGWPQRWWLVASSATALVPIALILGSSQRLASKIDRLLVHTVSIAGLTLVVFTSYVAIVVGLGRVPTSTERTIIGLSMAAAAVAAIFYMPARERLTGIANRVVYGERHAPDEVLRTFGSRLSRAIPMDELLLQLAEGLRKTFALDAAEIWTGSDGFLERSVSDPERGHARLRIGENELAVAARAGVSGPAWIKVWIPDLLKNREDSMVRVAPITHSGELLGLVVVERREANDVFGEENERILAELARQVALALHNVQLDSALQASLEELKRHAEDLRRSRERIVAAGDAERRKIERNLHDGAQQHLVALKVKLRLAQRVASDPEALVSMLEQLGGDVQETIEELRALSHGIFPPVLVDRGLKAALEAAAGRATLPTFVDGDSLGRYRPEIEAAIYFCCLEALQNAGKHAGEGASIRIELADRDGSLHFQVADDGAGFDADSKGLGAGFTNMQDRIGAVGGTIEIHSALGKGTTISGVVPIS